MSDILNDQRKFMRACGQTTDIYNKEQFELYCNLVREETQELEQALANKDDIEQLDALIDILVVTAGALNSLGVDAGGAWKEVMRSNFAKIDPRTGKVNRREDGKVLKPAGWEPPRLKEFLRRA